MASGVSSIKNSEKSEPQNKTFFDGKVKEIKQILTILEKERKESEQHLAVDLEKLDQLSGEIRQIGDDHEHMDIELSQLKKSSIQRKEQEETCKKISGVICGIAIVALIATGIVIITLRYV